MFKIQADIDNSGTIDYGEFIAAMLHLNKVQKEDHLFSAFNYFDKDGSGYITKDELQQACQQFGLQEDHLDDIIREADKDNVMDLNILTPPPQSHHPLHLSHFPFFPLLYLTCFLHCFQDGRIDYSEFVAMMQDTDFGKKGIHTS